MKNQEAKIVPLFVTKLVWQFMVTNDLSDDDIYKILYWIRFVDRYKFVIFDKTIYYDEDTIVADIVDEVLGFG